VTDDGRSGKQKYTGVGAVQRLTSDVKSSGFFRLDLVTNLVGSQFDDVSRAWCGGATPANVTGALGGLSPGLRYSSTANRSLCTRSSSSFTTLRPQSQRTALHQLKQVERKDCKRPALTSKGHIPEQALAARHRLIPRLTSTLPSYTHRHLVAAVD